MILMRDNVIYDELLDVIAPAAVVKGQVALIQDVYAFYMNDAAAGEEVVAVYKCRQALMDKVAESGEEIVAGDQVFYNPVTGLGSATKGVGMVFVGWAKEDALDTDEQVLINFDGTLHQLI